MPEKNADHFKDKIAVFIHWHNARSIKMQDDGLVQKGHANWKRICKMLLRNDYWAKGLSFSQHKSNSSYLKYKRVMEKRRAAWGIFPS